MKKISVIVIVILAIIVIDNSYANEKVIVSGHHEHAPLMWEENGKIVGAAVEIVRKIFGELGIEVESRYVGPWKRMLYNLEFGQVDMVCGAYITEERKKYAKFTEEFLVEDPTSVFVLKGKEFKFEKWEDLRGKICGELLGASQGEKFDNWRKKNMNIEYVGSRRQNLLKIEAGRIDCFVISRYAGLLLIKQFGYEGKIVPLKNPIAINYLHVGISKKSEFIKYIPQIDLRLKELREDGTVEKIIKANLDYYISTQKK